MRVTGSNLQGPRGMLASGPARPGSWFWRMKRLNNTLHTPRLVASTPSDFCTGTSMTRLGHRERHLLLSIALLDGQSKGVKSDAIVAAVNEALAKRRAAVAAEEDKEKGGNQRRKEFGGACNKPATSLSAFTHPQSQPRC